MITCEDVGKAFIKDSNNGKLVITRFDDTLAVIDQLYRWEEETKKKKN